MKTGNIIEITKEEVLKLLNIIKDCVRFDRFSISLNENRKENQDFIDEYNLNKKKQKKILLEMKVEDFCYATKDLNDPSEILYIFAPEVNLSDIENVILSITMYIKTKIFKDDDLKHVLLISFHKLNMRIKYAFK